MFVKDKVSLSQGSNQVYPKIESNLSNMESSYSKWQIIFKNSFLSTYVNNFCDVLSNDNDR